MPNKRLKLAGGDRFKGSGMLRPWRGTDVLGLGLRARLGNRVFQLEARRLGTTRALTLGMALPF